MTTKAKIIAIYGTVAVISAGIIAGGMWLRSGLRKPQEAPLTVESGKETQKEWFPIARDFTAVNQAGETVRLSQLKGKVWLVAEFFAVCPHCAMRNGAELRVIYDEFKNHPDFQMVCISVDPQADTVEKLKDYASALGADNRNWWFLNGGDEKAVHDYLEHELKFFGIRERKDPADIEANGRFSHDLGFLVVDRDFQVIGKWPLADARSEEAMKRQPELYDTLKAELFARIRAELAKQPSPAKP